MTDDDEAAVVAVAGAKGGVGKTTTTLNLAAALATRDVSVAAVELDLAMANVVEFLGFDEAPEPTVHDVLAGEARPIAAVCEREAGYAVVPSGTDLDGFAATDLDELPSLLAPIRESYDVVLLDTGAGASRETIDPLKHADRVLLTSTPRGAALRDAGKTERLAETVGTDVTGLLLTKTTASADGSAVSEFVDADVFGRVPEDSAVPAAQDAGEPVTVDAPESPAADAYQRIAERLAEAVRPDLELAARPLGASRADPSGTVVRPAEAVSDGGVATESAGRAGDAGRDGDGVGTGDGPTADGPSSLDDVVGVTFEPKDPGDEPSDDEPTAAAPTRVERRADAEERDGRDVETDETRIEAGEDDGAGEGGSLLDRVLSLLR